MATITSLLKPAHGSGGGGRQPYMVQMTVDLTAQAISSTAGDVVQCLTIPANTRVLHAGLQVVESATMNTGTNATVTLGAADVTLATADTLDLTFAGDGATYTAGKIRVYAVMLDVSDMGDMTADIVDRDMLA